MWFRSQAPWPTDHTTSPARRGYRSVYVLRPGTWRAVRYAAASPAIVLATRQAAPHDARRRAVITATNPAAVEDLAGHAKCKLDPRRKRGAK